MFRKWLIAAATSTTTKFNFVKDNFRAAKKLCQGIVRFLGLVLACFD